MMLVDAPTTEQAVVQEGYRRADPSAPQLRVDDLGVTRGDGVFETIGVFDGVPVQLEAHLRRLQSSAARLDLPDLRLDVWRGAVQGVIAAAAGDNLSLKAVLTRGIEGAETPSAWVLGYRAPDASRARADGLSVVTLTRGYPSDIAARAPWLLQGAKTTSYAVHMAALREAHRRGAEDVIFTSTDGLVLEGPTSTVVLRAGNTLVTPAADQGILAGTTQDLLFSFASDLGLAARSRQVPVAELEHAEEVWLCSSVRLCIPVRSLDGRELSVDSRLAEEFSDYARGRAEPDR